jgi:hypothetical protein
MQAIGATLPKFANVHSNLFPLFAGLLLLLPGDLLASVAGKINPFVFYPAVFLINASAWFILRKILLLDTETSSPSNS